MTSTAAKVASTQLGIGNTSAEVTDWFRQQLLAALVDPMFNVPKAFVTWMVDQVAVSGLNIPVGQIVGFNFQRQSSRVHLGSPSLQTITTSTETAISFNTSDFDYGTLWDGATKMVVRERGLYLIGGGAVYANASVTDERATSIKKNNSSYLASVSAGPANPNTTEHALVTLDELVEGDYVELRVYQQSGGNLDVGPVVSGDTRTNLWIARVGT